MVYFTADVIVKITTTGQRGGGRRGTLYEIVVKLFFPLASSWYTMSATDKGSKHTIEIKTFGRWLIQPWKNTRGGLEPNHCSVNSIGHYVLCKLGIQPTLLSNWGLALLLLCSHAQSV